MAYSDCAGANAYATTTLQTALLIRKIGGPRASRLLLCVMPAERTLIHAQMRHRVSLKQLPLASAVDYKTAISVPQPRKLFSAGLPPRTPPGMNSHLSTAVHTWKTHRIWATCLGDPGPLADAQVCCRRRTLCWPRSTRQSGSRHLVRPRAAASCKLQPRCAKLDEAGAPAGGRQQSASS